MSVVRGQPYCMKSNLAGKAVLFTSESYFLVSSDLTILFWRLSIQAHLERPRAEMNLLKLIYTITG